jgi:hypothetical protein
MNITQTGIPIVKLNVNDANEIQVTRNRRVLDTIRIGPNQVHAIIVHEDGEVEDLGISHNVLITSSAGGRDQLAALAGGVIAAGGQGSPATGSSGTTFTSTGSPWTTNQLAGMRVVFPISNLTTTPVFGNIISNTANVATVDGWWTPAEPSVIGTTPATTSAFIILPGGCPARYMALSENVTAPAAADTTLAGEITGAGGAARAQATYAHTLGTATYTLVKAFNITASYPAIHKMAIFTSGTGVLGSMMYSSLLNADANVVNGDTLTVTETVTIS